MAQGCRIAIIGGGPAGIMTAALLNKDFDITIFDPKPLLNTILPTGGGKCNLTFNEYDFKEFAKNYPRGEKFLYSIFARYCMPETVEYFEKIGIKTIALDNGKIFPQEMSSKFVREKLLYQIRNCVIEKNLVTNIELKNKEFIIHTKHTKSLFNKVIVTIGGHTDYNFLKNLNINIIEPKPALTGLCTKKDYSSISGIVLKNIRNLETKLIDDLLFTHFGISGPLTFKISSIKSRDNFPYALNFDLVNSKLTDEKDFQTILNNNPKKEIKNILCEYLPKNFVILFLNQIGISQELLAHKIDSTVRNKIYKNLKNYEITTIKPRPDGETVMSGGVDLKQINPKTLEHKTISNLYFAGEVLDIDGFCGGFNLQNCWSGAFVISEAIQAYST